MTAPLHDGAEPPWPQLGELVGRHMGLHFAGPRLADLQRGVAAAAAELGLADAASYARRLLATAPDTAQLQLLARHLTVGETYFFRDPQVLDALSGHVLAGLVRARRGRDQQLRIWSAGCASGEEAYSLAILLHQLLPDLADWRVTITATDINPQALQKAAAAIYGEWSFRAVPPAFKDAHFERRPDGRYALAPQIRNMVHFEYLNLVEDVYPSLATDTNAMDLVFCRNVLMYFTPAQIRGVIGRLHKALVDGGWLVVSPSETSQALFGRFAQVNFPGAVLYRKQAEAVAQPRPAPPASPAKGSAAHGRPVKRPPPAVQPAPLPPAAVGERLCAQGRYAEAEDLLARSVEGGPADPRVFSLLARAVANQGHLDQALAWCDRWVSCAKLDPAAHYLRAVVLVERGEMEQARASLQRTTFLAPEFVLAHFALGNLARRTGHDAEALRHFGNTRRLLERLQPGDLLPEGEGLSAGRLQQVLAAILEPHENEHE